MALDFLKTDKTIAAAKDTLGGGSFVWDTGLYPVVIDSIYMDQSSGGAHNVNLVFKTADGKSLNQTIYITSGTAKGCLNYYMDKQGEKQYLPGFNTVNDLALVTTGKDISELEPEEKLVEVYNVELKKKVPTLKPVFMDMIGQELQIGVTKIKEFKNIKDESTGKWVPGTEIKELNEVTKVFAEDARTVTEIRAEEPTAIFAPKWSERNNAEFIKDKTKGAKSAPAGGAASSAAPTKSLFAK